MSCLVPFLTTVTGAPAARAAVAPGVYAPVAVNRAAAHRQAPRLLASFTPPRHAIRARADPTPDHLLATPAYDEPATNFVDAHAFWTTTERPAAVLAQFAAQLPAGAGRDTRGSSAGPDGQQDRYWALRSTPGIAQRVVGVQVAELPGGRRVAVRFDGEAVWLSPRPAWERLPGSVRSLSFRGSGADVDGHPAPVSTAKTVTRPAAVSAIVHYLDGLQIVQPDDFACPAGVDSSTTVSFYGRGHRLLGRAVDSPTGCAEARFVVGGRTGPSLDDGSGTPAGEPASLTVALARIGAIGRCTASELAFSAAGSMSPAEIAFTTVNRSTAICALRGFAHVALQNSRGHAIPAHDHDEPRSGGADPVDRLPAHAGHFLRDGRPVWWPARGERGDHAARRLPGHRRAHRSDSAAAGLLGPRDGVALRHPPGAACGTAPAVAWPSGRLDVALTLLIVTSRHRGEDLAALRGRRRAPHGHLAEGAQAALAQAAVLVDDADADARRLDAAPRGLVGGAHRRTAGSAGTRSA